MNAEVLWYTRTFNRKTEGKVSNGLRTPKFYGIIKSGNIMIYSIPGYKGKGIENGQARSVDTLL